MAAAPRDRILAVGFVVVASIWGLNYLFVREGLTLAAPLWLALLRAGVGAAGTTIFLLPRAGTRRLDRRGRVDAFLLGLPNTAFFFGLWFLAARQVLPGETAVLVYTFPLWVALLTGPVMGDRLGLAHWAAIGAGFLGVALVSQPWQGGSGSLQLVPVLELLAGAASWATGTVLMQRRFRAPELQEANAYQLLGGTLGLLAFAVAFEPTSVPSPSPVLLADVLWLGLAGTAVAYSIWFYLLGRVPVASLTGFTFLVPLVALAASAVIYHERLDVAQGTGVLLVLAAIYVIGRRIRPSAPSGPPAATSSGS
jgi:drug/metabolite transporter (DMT)-like permease